jgi:L,D-transpeptidase YcbB
MMPRRPRGLIRLLAGLSWLTLSGLVPLAAQAPAQEQPAPALSQTLQVILRARLPASGKPPELPAAGGSFRAAPDLPCFYDRRQYAPAWIGDKGVRPDADELIAALADAPADGLDPERYRLADLRQRLAQAKSAPVSGDLAEIDLRLTDAFLRFAADLYNGAVNPDLIYSDCRYNLPETDLAAALESAVTGGHVRQSLAELPPPHAGYKALKAALAQYRALAARGGWPAVPEGPSLKPGDRGERVAAVRARLEASGELAPNASPAEARDLFDAPLQAALVKFQDQHGLDPDGKIGKGTLAALNVPAGQRVRQIEINLDRWRWLPRDLGERYIMVNIGGFHLDVVDGGQTVLAMKIVGGKPTTRTPMFTGRMIQIVLNPYWNVPASIARKEVLPKIAREPGYQASEGFEILHTKSGVEVRQRPGPKNALGKIKFLFPNRFNVYLHDTPARSLFSRTVRGFSHGCMRIEKPLELAEYLLKDSPLWTPEKITETIDSGKETWINIPKPLPVHIVYWTAWVDDAGTLQLRDDLYGRDKPLLQILGTEEAARDQSPAIPQATRRPG